MGSAEDDESEEEAMKAERAAYSNEGPVPVRDSDVVMMRRLQEE